MQLALATHFLKETKRFSHTSLKRCVHTPLALATQFLKQITIFSHTPLAIATHVLKQSQISNMSLALATHFLKQNTKYNVFTHSACTFSPLS